MAANEGAAGDAAGAAGSPGIVAAGGVPADSAREEGWGESPHRHQRVVRLKRDIATVTLHAATSTEEKR
jgi:hypothetical protein